MSETESFSNPDLRTNAFISETYSNPKAATRQRAGDCTPRFNASSPLVPSDKLRKLPLFLSSLGTLFHIPSAREA
jgi:hypothetical protein